MTDNRTSVRRTDLEILHRKETSYVRNYVLEGNLRSSKIRNLYWRTLLENFSSLSVHEWVNSIRKTRDRYRELKVTHTLDPHRQSFIPDDNPLSQDENVSLQHFCRPVDKILSSTYSGTFSVCKRTIFNSKRNKCSEG